MNTQRATNKNVPTDNFFETDFNPICLHFIKLGQHTTQQIIKSKVHKIKHFDENAVQKIINLTF